MCVFSSVFLLFFLWVQVPGIGPKAKAARRERSRHCSEREEEEGLWCWKGLKKMKEGQRKLWGGTRGQTELGVFFWEEGVGLGGRGATRENESNPGDRAWEGCSEDAHDCFKVPLYIVNESGGGGAPGSFPFCASVHVWLCRGWHCVERHLCILLKEDQSVFRHKGKLSLQISLLRKSKSFAPSQNIFYFIAC